jgi:hypothetical protein
MVMEMDCCPDCGHPIEKHLGDNEYPICVKCDVWFEKIGDWVCRNSGAMKEYNRIWREQFDNMNEILG